MQPAGGFVVESETGEIAVSMGTARFQLGQENLCRDFGLGRPRGDDFAEINRRSSWGISGEATVLIGLVCIERGSKDGSLENRPRLSPLKECPFRDFECQSLYGSPSQLNRAMKARPLRRI